MGELKTKITKCREDILREYWDSCNLYEAVGYDNYIDIIKNDRSLPIYFFKNKKDFYNYFCDNEDRLELVEEGGTMVLKHIFSDNLWENNGWTTASNHTPVNGGWSYLVWIDGEGQELIKVPNNGLTNSYGYTLKDVLSSMEGFKGKTITHYQIVSSPLYNSLNMNPIIIE